MTLRWEVLSVQAESCCAVSTRPLAEPRAQFRRGPCLWSMGFWNNPRWLIAQQAVKSMSWSGRPLTLESGLLESELASGGLLWCLCSQPVSAPPPAGSCPLSTFALNPTPFPVSMVCSTYCLDQWKRRRGLCEGGDGVRKSLHLREALLQFRALGSTFSNCSGEPGFLSP